VAKLFSQSDISQVRDRLLGELPDENLGVRLAALIYLRWADFQESEHEAIAAFDDTDYKPVLPASLHWRSWHALPPYELQWQIAERLSHALDGLNNSRSNPLAAQLHRIAPTVTDLGRLNPHSLSPLVRWLADQPFETPSDRRALLDIFDSLTDGVPSYPGEFRTPPDVARILVEIASPAAGDRVYDPCFGSAALLTSAYDHVQRKEKDRFSRSGASPLTVFGVELNPNAYVIGLARLALDGIDDPQLELGNSLERTPSNTPRRDGFDIVLANPPWGMRADPAGLEHYPVRTTDSTGLFIQHALSHLRPDGRAVIIVPQGFLFRGGPEQRLRRMLLEQHTVEAVVALSDSAFMPYTTVGASILVLRRGGRTERIRMFDRTSRFGEGKSHQFLMALKAWADQPKQQVLPSQTSGNSWDVDAESLAEVEWDLTPRRRNQSELSGVLVPLRSKIDVLPLKECCLILAGPPIKSSDLTNEPMGEAPIPYVRIKDVQRGQATKGSSWLLPDSAASLDAKCKLRTGDVLLSKSGAIGKPGVVRNGAVGAVAGNGLFVLRPVQNRLDPHFLVAYLDSSECRAWLSDKARGATIQHLSKRALEELPVPLPPLPLQQLGAKACRENSVDVLAFLARLLIEGGRDPAAEWLYKAEQNLDAVFLDEGDDLPDISLLDRFACEIPAFRDEVMHGSQEQSSVAWWISTFIQATTSLRGVHTLPRSPALLSVLQAVARGLRDEIVRIKGQGSIETKARNLSMTVTSWLDKACLELLEDVKVALGTDTGTLEAGKMVEFSLRVHNQSALPLRDLQLATTPDWGRGDFGYLAENAKVAINLAGAAPKIPGTFTLTVDWSGSKLDGQRVKGSREIALTVLELGIHVSETQADLGGSPYICGGPVPPERNDVFFGREELLDQVRRQIIQSGNVVLLEGNRRSGKSSILWHLAGPEAVPGWMGIYCSFQRAEGSREGVGVPTAEVFRAIANSIAKSLQYLGGEIPLPNGTILPVGTGIKDALARKTVIKDACRDGISEGSPFSDFLDYAEVALEKLAERGFGLLLMLDEFDKLQEGIKSGITSPQVLDNIRFLVQTYPRFSAILTGSRRLQKLREEYWSALFGIGTRFGVSSLPVEAARRLVTEPVKGKLTFSHEAVELAIALTASHPYLLQCLCNRVFDMAAQLKTRSVTLDLVNQAAEVLVEDNEHFASAWNYIRSDRRRFILTLCHRDAGGADLLRFGVIQEKLGSQGIEVDDDMLIADLEFLRELELITLVGESSGGHYVMNIPLMGRWIERQQDFAAVKSRARSETEDWHE